MGRKRRFRRAAAYLARVRTADENAERLRKRAENLRLLLTDKSAPWPDQPAGGGTDPRRDERLHAEIDGMEREIKRAEEAARGIRLEAGMKICRIPEPTAQKILILRYLDGKSMKEAAEEAGYGITQGYKFHDMGMKALERTLGKEDSRNGERCSS